MPAISTGLALGLGAIGAAGSIGGAAIASHGAGKAADAQAAAAEQNAQLQYALGKEGLDFQKQQYKNSLQAIAPYYQSGQSGLANLDYLLGLPVPNQPVINPANFSIDGSTTPASPLNTQGRTNERLGMGDMPLLGAGNRFPQVNTYLPPSATRPVTTGAGIPVKGTAIRGTGPETAPANMSSLVNPALGAAGSLSQDFTEQFKAPTAEEARKTPGYQFQLQEGLDALNRSAAAKGGLITGGTARDLQTFGQGLADSTYGETYNRAANEYTNRFNIFNQNQANKYNRLASMAGLGQVQANQLANLGTTTGNNMSGLLMGMGQNVSNDLQNAANARASGYVGSSNAWGNAMGGMGNNIMNTYLMSKLFGGGGGGTDLSSLFPAGTAVV